MDLENVKDAAATGEGLSHCPYRRATDLLQRLAPGKMRIGFLIGVVARSRFESLMGPEVSP